jgi:hypothetical protein
MVDHAITPEQKMQNTPRNSRSRKVNNKRKERIPRSLNMSKGLPDNMNNYSTNDKIQLFERKSRVPMSDLIKYADGSITPTNVTATGTTGALLNVPQGTAQSDRIGDVIFVRKLVMTALNITAANADVYSHVRVILYQWRPSIGAEAPAVNTVLQTPTTNSVFSNLNYANRRIYEILWDRTFSMTGTATVPTVGSDYVLTNVNIPIKLPSLEYQLASSSNSENTICILYISDSAAAPFPTIQFNFRMFYSDA